VELSKGAKFISFIKANRKSLKGIGAAAAIIGVAIAVSKITKRKISLKSIADTAYKTNNTVRKSPVAHTVKVFARIYKTKKGSLLRYVESYQRG
jgi:formiminotetrahydrofolate cyclodeaminase